MMTFFSGFLGGRGKLSILNSLVQRSNRIAHCIKDKYKFSPDLSCYGDVVSSRGQWLSGADIHPTSKIGERFILDHAVGTVIGETTVIGNDCYVLGGVQIGASGIATNLNIKRHPTIGNNVQIGAYAKIFGSLTIGDNVFIGSNCLIYNDVPSDSRVVLKSVTQIQSSIASIS